MEKSRLVALATAHPGLAPVVGLLAPPPQLSRGLLLLLPLAHAASCPPLKRWSCSARVGGAISSVTSHCAMSVPGASAGRPTRDLALSRRFRVARTSSPIA